MMVYVNNTEDDDNNISQVLRGSMMKGPPLPSFSDLEGAEVREGDRVGEEGGILVKVPSDLMTPGCMFLKKLRFMD